MTPAMYYGIRHAVEVVENDDSLAGLVLTGTGDVFIPGGDLRLPTIDAWADLRRLPLDVMTFDVLRGMAKPVVCAANGICQGGGMLMSMPADVAVVSERATFRALNCCAASPTWSSRRSSRTWSASLAPATCCLLRAPSRRPRQSHGVW